MHGQYKSDLLYLTRQTALHVYFPLADIHFYPVEI